MLLLDLLGDARQLEVAAFATKHPAPVLLGRESSEKAEQVGMQTLKLDGARAASPMEQMLGLASTAELFVFPLVPRSGSSAEERISIGRTVATDLCLCFARVSKYHAFFSRSAAGSWSLLTDAGSANGTYVDGRRLSPNVAAEVRDRTIVSFADHSYRFHFPEGLWRALRELRTP